MVKSIVAIDGPRVRFTVDASFLYFLSLFFMSKSEDVDSALIAISSIGGLVVKSIVAIDGPRVRFTVDANLLHFCPLVHVQS